MFGCGSAAPATEKVTGEGADDGGSFGTSVDAAPVGTGYELLLNEAERIQKAAVTSVYSHTTTIDEATGTFDFDCSGFVDYAMSRVVPVAYLDLPKGTLPRPLADTYVSYIASVASTNARWQRVAHVADIVPGDIVSWLEPTQLASSDTGHVMVVAAPPQAVAAEWHVKVIDSANSPHGTTDTRSPSGQGIGIGTVVLIADATGAATGYRWSTEAASVAYKTQVALGHLP